MKLNITVDCTPQEARTFLGLPDVEAFNEQMVSAVRERMMTNLSQMNPEDIMRYWSSFGVQSQEHFFKFMQQAAQASVSGLKGG